MFDSLSAAGPNMSADSAGQIISADAAGQNMSADASGQNIGRPPRIGGATATGWYFRLTLHHLGSHDKDCIMHKGGGGAENKGTGCETHKKF